MSEPTPDEPTKPAHSEREWRLARLASRQRRNVTLAQMDRLGFPEGAVRYRRRIGRLHPVFKGVLAVGTPQDSRAGFFLAAVLSVGEDAAISHFSAGQNFGVFNARVGEIHLTCPRPLRDRGVLRLHERNVPTTVHDGIPTTTIEQTLVDLATVMYSDRAYTRAVREALVQDLTTWDRLTDAATHRQPGAPRLRAVLAKGDVRTRSRLEDAALDLLSEHRLPTPLTNVRLHGMEVDMYWPDRGLVLEVDGPPHDNPLARADDARKQAELESAGLTVVRWMPR